MEILPLSLTHLFGLTTHASSFLAQFASLEKVAIFASSDSILPEHIRLNDFVFFNFSLLKRPDPQAAASFPKHMLQS